MPLVVERDGETADVLLETGLDVSGSAVIAELAAAVGGDPTRGLYCARTGRAIASDAPIASAGLLRGDRLSFGSPASTTRRGIEPVSGWELVVAGGPAAGQRFALSEKRTIVGRDPQCTVALDDPALSAQHVEILLEPPRVSVRDAGSRNGTAVDGIALAVGEDREVSDGDVVRVGRTLFSIEQSRLAQGSPVPLPDGSIPFNRPPRVNPPFVAPHFSLDPLPATPQRGRLPLAASLMPVLMGVVLYLVIHNVAMLLFAALSPLMAAGSLVEDRRSGKGRYKHDLAAFRRRLSDLRAELDEARAAEGTARRAAAPSLSQLSRRALAHDSQLWERRPDDSDFLLLRLGSASRPSDVRVDIPPGGEDELRAEASELMTWYGSVPEVPVTAALRDLGVLALAGSRDRVQALARGLVLQLVTLQSPTDLQLFVAVADDVADSWSWLKWLPHVADDDGIGVAVGEASARALVESINRLLDEREAADRHQARRGAQRPAAVVVVDSSVAPERSVMAALLGRGRESDIYVVWLGEHRNLLPGESGGIAELDPDTARLTYTEAASAVSIADVTADGLDPVLALEAALALAPLEDIGAMQSGGRIPSRVSLLELLNARDLDAHWVEDRWMHSSGLGATVGRAPDTDLSLDLRSDGPHGLVAGTTGAGKSELLQTLVGSLALEHPPTRLTFLLVDYKGGAAFKDCVKLPHTVGFVTDLDEHLTHRALTSLEAELRRREAVLRDANARDLMELERLDPALAPPALLIVIDEFATLAKEVPDFVSGVVDVAQRGRSLGVHLLLATQRPAGVVTDNIRANTNLRIALRVSDPAESSDVIGVTDAAAIPRTRPGRGLARTGHAELTPFQTAYVGGMTGAHEAMAVGVRTFSLSDATARAPSAYPPEVSSAESDLARIVSACTEAAARLSLPEPTRPWLAPPPAVIPLETIEQPAQQTAVALGVIDEPARQRLRPFVLDLAEAGSVIVYGAGGSGKTTVLRTLAYAMAARSRVSELNVYGLDFASRGLLPLEALPHCGSVVPGEDRERVERTFALIRRMIDERKTAFSAAGVFSVDEFLRARPDQPLPRLLVLLDGYAAFVAAFERINYGALVDSVPRLVADGRPLGIHFAITADRRGAIPNALSSAAPTKVVLRMPSEDDYGTLGFDLREARGVKLTPGRGFAESTLELQTAVISTDPSAEAQASAIDALAASLREREGAAEAPPIGQLAAVVSRADMPRPTAALTAFIGIADSSLAPIAIDLSQRHFLVAGPYHSGRSTALRTIAENLRTGDPDIELHLLAPRRSPLPDLSLWTTTARGAEECMARLSELQTMVEARRPGEKPLAIFVDDGEELSDTLAGPALEAILRRGRDLEVRIVAAAERAGARAFSGWPRELRKDEQGLLLQPDDGDAGTLNTSLPRRSTIQFPPGRGYLVSRGSVELVQVAADD